MEQLKIYTVKSKNSSTVWEFKYHLNGVLNEFKVLDGELSEKQLEWLFKQGQFPYWEFQINIWEQKLKANFEIIKGEPDLTFEALWSKYNFKVKRIEAEKAFSKLKKPDIIKVFIAVPGYDKYLQKKQTAKAHLSTFINQRYFEDDWSNV